MSYMLCLPEHQSQRWCVQSPPLHLQVCFWIPNGTGFQPPTAQCLQCLWMRWMRMYAVHIAYSQIIDITCHIRQFDYTPLLGCFIWVSKRVTASTVCSPRISKKGPCCNIGEVMLDGAILEVPGGIMTEGPCRRMSTTNQRVLFDVDTIFFTGDSRWVKWRDPARC